MPHPAGQPTITNNTSRNVSVVRKYKRINGVVLPLQLILSVDSRIITCGKKQLHHMMKLTSKTNPPMCCSKKKKGCLIKVVLHCVRRVGVCCTHSLMQPTALILDLH